MKCFLIIVLATLLAGTAKAGNMVCYYDSASHEREGTAYFSRVDLEPALQFCNYLVYGYAGIDLTSFELVSLHKELDIMGNHWRTITALKTKHPQLRVLLSIGGDKDPINDVQGNQYLMILEDKKRRDSFVDSALSLLKTYGFDGIDLAWQFPKDEPKVVRSGIKKAWNSVKEFFAGHKEVDDRAEQHKEQFTLLTQELRNAFHYSGYLLTLTMLPNVNAETFIDIPAVIGNVDHVNLCTFDFLTPMRDPKIADYPAPLYAMYEREPTHNVDYQVQHWLNNTAPAYKLHVGVPAFGRSWVMTTASGLTGYPPVPETDGPAPGGRQTVTPGLLSWPEVCEKLHNNKELTGDSARLRKVGDPTKRFGTYAYRSANENGTYGLWVGYEEPTTAAIKASYVNAKVLGGVALFDLSLDDFRGQCAGEKYPILRSIKFKL